jgi:hypothetical protein
MYQSTGLSGTVQISTVGSQIPTELASYPEILPTGFI